MTPSQQAKAHGLKSLRQLSLIALVPVSTLKDWARDKPERFKRVCEMAEAWYFKLPGYTKPRVWKDRAPDNCHLGA